jgi:hypothetical protein
VDRKTEEDHMNVIIDRKFQILAVNPANGHRYTERDALLLCAKDKAVPVALKAYRDECRVIGANPEHIESIDLLIQRVERFQAETGGGRVPDTVGQVEVQRCLFGIGL